MQVFAGVEARSWAASAPGAGRSCRGTGGAVGRTWLPQNSWVGHWPLMPAGGCWASRTWACSKRGQNVQWAAASGTSVAGCVSTPNLTMAHVPLLLPSLQPTRLTPVQVIYLPVVPWRSAPRDPSPTAGLSGAVSSHVRRVQGEVSQLWDKMAAAEQGTLAHRVYK